MVQKQKEPCRTTAKEYIFRVELKYCLANFSLREVQWWRSRRLLAQDVHSHDAAKGMGDQMNFAVLSESGVVTAPQTVNPICLFDHRLDHPLLMAR